VLDALDNHDEIFVTDKEGYIYEKGFIPISERAALGFESYGEFLYTRFIQQCHPRAYRFLYDGLVYLLKYLLDEDVHTYSEPATLSLRKVLRKRTSLLISPG